MILKDCEVTIKPKGDPMQNVTFWCADVKMPDGFPYGDTINTGPLIIALNLKLDEGKPAEMAYGLIGQRIDE